MSAIRSAYGRFARRLYSLLPLVIIVPVVVLSIRYRFDGLYGQDAYAYYRYAMETVRQNLQALQLPAPFFWPPGYPLLVALLSFVTGVQPLAAQAISLVAGALTPLFTAMLAFELWPRQPTPQRRAAQVDAAGIAMIAGLIAALTPQLWQSSAVSMSDTTALASATLGVWALVRYGRGGQSALLALASAALCFAMLTRMVYASLVIVMALYALLLLARRPLRTATTHAFLAAAVALVILTPLFSALWRQAPGGDPAFLGHLGPQWWRIRHALQNEFVTGNGHLRYPMVNGLYYALTPAHRYFFTPMMAPLLLPGVWRLWKWRSLHRFLVLLGWPMAIYIVISGYPAQNFRFSLAFLPPLAILAALGLFTLLAAAGRLRPFVLLGVVGAAAWMVYGGWTLTESFMAHKQADLATVRWTENQLPDGAQLFTFHITLTVEQYTELVVHDLYHQTFADIDAHLQEPRPAYLLIDRGNITSQWAEHAPGKNYERLQTAPGLTHLGDHRHYSLFRIGDTE